MTAPFVHGARVVYDLDAPPLVPSPPPEPVGMARPFVKWAGGKTALLPELLPRLPDRIKNYWEPMAGGGALLWQVAHADATVVCDMNADLIETYLQIQNNVEFLIQMLRDVYESGHRDDPSRFYYDIRGAAREGFSAPGIAARFIYLNKTCFNGLYRVNKHGQFNVPFGKREKFIVDADRLRACSRRLRGAHIVNMDLSYALAARPGDAVYFDPPYVPVRRDSKGLSFTAYTAGGFGPVEQERLRNVARELREKGVFVMVSNSDTPEVRELYRGFTVETVMVRRNINSKGTGRGAVPEVIIT